jgi:hypothetical protein
MTESETALRPSEQRTAERREQKQGGRSRRAELLLERDVKEKSRQDALEDRQAKADGRLAQVEARLEAHETRIQQLEALAARVSTPRLPAPATPNP